MRKFKTISSVAVPWLLPNIDTDIITPMKRILRNLDNLAAFAFEPFRFIDGDGDKGELNPDFILNMPEYQNAQIMLVGENFGSGSSRETAPEAIAGMGIYCLIGISFGGIFFKNCFQQGILPIVLPKEVIEHMAEQTLTGRFSVDLQACEITTPNGEVIPFKVESGKRNSLLEGLDDVGITLKDKARIQEFQQKDRTVRPWVYQRHTAVTESKI